MSLDPRTLRRNGWALTLASALALVGIGRLLWSSYEGWNNGPIAVLATAAGVLGMARFAREWSAGRDPRRTHVAWAGLLLAWGALAGGAEFAVAAATLTGVAAGWCGRSQALLRWLGALSAGAGVLLGFVAQPVPRVGGFEVAGWFAVLPLLVLLHGEALGSRSRRSVGDDPSRWRWSLALALVALWLANLGASVSLPGHGANYPEGPGEGPPRERSLGFDDLDRERPEGNAFPSDLQVEGDLGQPSDRAFAEIRGAGLDVEGPLYLRALVLDKFTTEGLGGSRFDLRAASTDLSDGVEDGWVRWAGPSPQEREAVVVQRVFRIADRDWAPVLTLPGVQALNLSGIVRADTGAIALGSPAVPEWTLTQRWRPGRHWSHVPADASGARPSPEGLALPGGPGRRELDRWAEALRVQLGLGDRERPSAAAAIEAIVGLFEARGFRYVLEGPRGSGARGLAEFMERREGYCVHYAATSVFLLRSLGIPARVATGFTSDEFTEAGTRCVVRGRDAHAWVEVDVEGFGWARFDPTPVTDRDAAWEQLEQAQDPLESWSEDLRRRWERLVAGEWSQLGALLTQLARLPLAFLATGYGPWIAVASMALIVAWRMRRALRPSRSAPGEGVDPRDVRERLAAALAGRGLVRGRLDTWPRMGAKAARQGRPWSAELQRIAVDLDRERFGGIPLGPDESERVARLVVELRREAAEAKAAKAAASRT